MSTSGNADIIQLELTPELQHEEIVQSYVYDTEMDSLHVELNSKYKRKVIISPIDSKWPKTIELYAQELRRKSIDTSHITMLCDCADDNAPKILKWRQNRKRQVLSEELDKEEQKKETAAQKLLSLAKEQCHELFVDQYREPYAAVKLRDHQETLNISHSRFRNWICKAYYELNGSVPNSESITNAINVLKANAEFDGNSKELHLRVAYDRTARAARTTIYYDLTNKDWEAVKLTPEDWVVDKAPVIFRRHNAQPQVYPSKEYRPGIFDEFISLLNIKGEQKKLLLKCYIISTFIPDIDRIVLMLHGGPGAAKTSFEELLKLLIDPSSILTFALPRDIAQVIQQLDHNYVVFYDNVSEIVFWISDQFCRASTGGGSSKRSLYTDDDDKVYNFKRNVGFNGINLAATKSDLLDRGIILPIERIDPKEREKKQKILHDFEEIRPQVLGYIFDIVVKVLRYYKENPPIEFETLPRMADFAEVAEVISRCMGNDPNEFMKAYQKNIEQQTQEILDTSLVASAIFKFMSDRKEWKGNATGLLELLDHQVTEKIQRSKYWPKTASVLSRRINEVKANLREVGVEIEEGEADTITRVKSIDIKNTNPALTAGQPDEQNSQDKKILFWSRLTDLTKADNSFTGDRLQQSLVGSSIYGEVVFLIKEAVENGEIETVDGHFDTYRMVGKK
jgi:hypothetical protein